MTVLRDIKETVFDMEQNKKDAYRLLGGAVDFIPSVLSVKMSKEMSFPNYRTYSLTEDIAKYTSRVLPPLVLVSEELVSLGLLSRAFSGDVASGVLYCTIKGAKKLFFNDCLW